MSDEKVQVLLEHECQGPVTQCPYCYEKLQETLDGRSNYVIVLFGEEQDDEHRVLVRGGNRVLAMAYATNILMRVLKTGIAEAPERSKRSDLQ